MILSEENNLLYNLYNTHLIKENPDTLTLGDRYYSYDNPDLGNYTGLMYPNGKFLMSKKIMGHSNLKSFIYDRSLDEIPDLIHNFDSIDDIYKIGNSGQAKFRLWPKFKIFSLWDRNFKPEYKPAVDAILDSMNDYNNEYKFDPNLYSGSEDEFKSYDEFIKEELGEDEVSAIEQEARTKIENERLMADVMAGIKPRNRSIDADTSRSKVRVPSWQRNGD